MSKLVLKARRAAPADRLKIFVSYSRQDAAVADSLVDALAAHGYDVTIDRRSLPFGEKWKNELSEFIRLCDTVVWLISERSVHSEWVNWELDEVARRNKRLVPVMIDGTSRDTLPRQLGEIHVLPLEGQFSLERDLALLVRVLDTDGPWLKEASRLADRAYEWLTKQRPAALLLRGGALSAAEQWKDRRSTRAPAPAQEVLNLILASRQAATRQQRWWTGGIAAAAVIAVGVAGYALTMRELAVVGEAKAVAEGERAAGERDRALATTSRILARDSQTALARKDPVKALLIALEGLPSKPGERPHVWQAEASANAALFEWRYRGPIAAPGHWSGWSPILSADGAIAIGRRPDETVLWDTRTGVEITRYEGGPSTHGAKLSKDAWKLYVHAGGGKTGVVDLRSRAFTSLSVPGVAFDIATFSRDGARLLTTHDDRKARLWDTVSGTIIQTFDMASQLAVYALLSDDGQVAVVETDKRELLVFDAGGAVARCRVPIPLRMDDWNEWFFALSDRRLVTAHVRDLEAREFGSATASIWNLETCDLNPTLAGLGDQEKPSEPEPSPREPVALHKLEPLGRTGKLVLSTIPREDFLTGASGSVGVWDLASQTLVAQFDGALEYVINGDNLVVVKWSSAGDAKISVVDLHGHEVELASVVDGGSAMDIEGVLINANGTRVAVKRRRLSTFAPGLWDASTGRRLAALTEPGISFEPKAFSPDGRFLLTVSSKDATAHLRDATTGNVAAVLDAGDGQGRKSEFSPDGKVVALSAGKQTWHFLSIDPDVRTPLLQPDATRVGFSADGKFVFGQSLEGAAVFETFAWDSTTGLRTLLEKPAIDALRSGRKILFDTEGEYYVKQERSETAGSAAPSAGSDSSSEVETRARFAEPLEALGRGGAARRTDELDRSGSSSRPQKASDLVFLVHVGAALEHWHWLLGNDGQVRMLRIQNLPSESLKPMNGSSFTTEGFFFAIVGLPSSHQSFDDIEYVDMAFSPEGTRVVTIWKQHNKGGSETRILRLWQQGRDEPAYEFRSTVGRQPVGASFDPTGRRVLVRYDDGTIRVLTASTLEEVAVISPRDGDNRFYEVSADGTRILTRNNNGDFRKMTIPDKTWMRLWFVEPTIETLVDRARIIVPRCLTPLEREQELLLSPAPHRWCIAGTGGEKDPTAWQPKWPYRSPAWREWQLARDKGEDLPLPKTE